MNLFQHLVLLIDWAILWCFIYALWIIISGFIYQLYIRTRCRYKGIKEKPGRACVICDHQRQCDRAMKSEEYKQYFQCYITSPEQAKKMFDEIWAEETAKE